MCGRYTLRRAAMIAAAMEAMLQLPELDDFYLAPRYNIAPSQQVLIVRLNKDSQRTISATKWGLIPSWAKSLPKTQPINARAETVATSGMFRQAFARRRCLVPADGFYEWKGAKPPKQPYFIRRDDDGIFAFAGLWERWKPSPDDDPLDTVTIITTQPNDTMRPIHNRMPVILHDRDYDRWLSREVPVEAVTELLQPFDGPMQANPVSTRVNNVKNDGPDLVKAI